MNILIATSGNISRLEISTLATALNKNHRVTIACMARDGGHQGLAFSTSGTPSRVDKYNYTEAMTGRATTRELKTLDNILVYEFYSRPADAISILLSEILKHDPPDLIITGISNGTNLGSDIYSSSHVGMAMQATFAKIPAVVIATEYNPGGNTALHLKNVTQFLENNLDEFAQIQLPPYTFLNINVPRVDKYAQLLGVQFTQMGKLGKMIEFDENKTQKGQTYFWTRFSEAERNPDKEEDRAAYEAGYVSITPICYDAGAEEVFT